MQLTSMSCLFMGRGMDQERRDPLKDFFISYTQRDRSWAEWVAWHLEVAGYSTIIQAWNFRPGSNFILEMDKAARVSTHTIAILSPAYLTAFYT